MNYNKVILVGRITHDPELRATPSGTEVVNFQLAVNRYGKDKQADFFRIACFGRTAQFVNSYVRKGTLLLVEGSLRTNVWQDSTGQKRSTVEINANRVEIMEKKGAQSAENFSENFEDGTISNDAEDLPDTEDGLGDESDEIPF